MDTMKPQYLITSVRITCSIVALSLALGGSARAALYTFSGPFASAGSGAGVIAAGNAIPLADVHNLSGTGLGSVITDIILTVHLGTGDGLETMLGKLRLGDLTSSSYVNFNPTTADFTVNLGSTFNGLNPNANWTLSFANPAGFFDNSLTGWSLDITAVPEPLNVALGIFGVLALGAGGTSWYLKRRRVHWRPQIWPSQ